MLQSLPQVPLWLRAWLIFPLAFLNGWLALLLFGYFQPLSSLLVTALILAFLLNFPIKFLHQRGLARGWATALVLLSSLLFVSIAALTLVPLIIEQLSGLVNTLPDLVESGSGRLQTLQEWLATQQIPVDLSGTIDSGIAKLSDILQATSSGLLDFALSAISSLINILLLLVLTVFMVASGERAWNGLFSWLPTTWRLPLQTSIQQTFQTYFAAQALLAGILSLSQTIVFWILDVPYAVLFGVSIGVTTLIPLASGATIIAVSFILALKNLTLGLKALVICIIVGQINDNVIAPRLVGRSIGLNPIWLLIALFIGNKFAGVLGLLIAVPIASVIKGMAEAMRSPEGELIAQEPERQFVTDAQ
ncbi:MAG: AI-2E family transporter [Cyanobacteria bacterium P01_A01_bin.17]